MGESLEQPALPVNLVRQLHAQGIQPEQLAALGLYPLVHVAWADEEVQQAEREVITRSAADSGLPDPALGLLDRWLSTRPPNADVLLDLTWQLVERLPAPAQRLAAEGALELAETVARAAGGGPGVDPVCNEERAALSELVRALGGKGAETERRLAFAYGLEFEDRLEDLAVVGPQEVATCEPGRESCLEGVLSKIIRLGSRMRSARRRPPSNRGKLRKLLEKTHRDLCDEERGWVGSDASLADLDGWQLCRFVILLVCRGATYDRAYHSSLGLDDKNTQPEDLARVVDSSGERPLARDRQATLALVHRILDEPDVPMVCRDYVRIAVELFDVGRSLAKGAAKSVLIPLAGRHDLRSFAGHAWCLFAELERHVACPLDPTAGDALWDLGLAQSPFNALLDGRGMSTASALLVRLVEEASLESVAAGRGIVAGAGEGALPLLVRVLGHRIASSDLTPEEFALAAAAGQAAGASGLLMDALVAEHRQWATMVPIEERSGPLGVVRRGRLADLFVRSGLMGRSDLPVDLRKALNEMSCWERDQAASKAKVGRNDPCPCGSGQKYKRCCGR